MKLCSTPLTESIPSCRRVPAQPVRGGPEFRPDASGDGALTGEARNTAEAIKITGPHLRSIRSCRDSISSCRYAQHFVDYRRPARSGKRVQAALEVNPSDEQAECRLGDMALQRDDLKEASQRFNHALQLKPDDPRQVLAWRKFL